MDKTRIIDTIQRSRTFTRLDTKSIDELADNAMVRLIRKDEFLWREGDEIQTYYIIERGLIRVFRALSSGRELVLSIIGPGGSCGDNVLMGNTTIHVSAQAISDTLTIAFRKSYLQSFIKGRPDLIMRIGETISRRLDMVGGIIADLIETTAEDRVIKVLCYLFEGFGSTLKFSHQQIADMAGVTRETTSLILAKMAESNLIQCSRRKIVVLSKDRLRFACCKNNTLSYDRFTLKF
ncbi:MAG: Crp/Fnr family transcriptional regulator [Anaerolineales bacterium]|nr:Crp/Fnr family transcriptional regulator [Anaerolineales bacterium]